jgi:hypothetical protein
MLKLHGSRKFDYIFLSTVFISLACAFASSNGPTVFAVQYSNYTSEKYQIQFQYPSDWEFKEKMNRFEEGTDLSIRKISFDNPGAIMISYQNDLIKGFGSTDFTTAFYSAFRDSIGSDYSQEYRVIEQPSFVDIDGQKTGTFLFTMKDKYEDSPQAFAIQNWITFIGNHHGYLIGFWSPTSYFDAPENKEIRDHFISSIKFLGKNNATNNNITNRFG